MPADLLAVGVITSPYGIHGEVKGKSFSGEPGHFATLTEALFRKGAREKRLRIESARPHPQGVILKIAGVSTPEEARKLVGFEIWVPRSQAAQLAEGEYYAADLCECRIWFGDELIGQGALRVGRRICPAPGSGANASGKVFLVPFTDHFVGDVDVPAGRISLKKDEIVR